MANRLAQETSPYLLQHRDNPIDWYPWGDEAFRAAREQGKPIFLSVGYSSCHWCHVMEAESFVDLEVAEVLNAGFVSIKVDREERPDVDETYMTAVQLASGRGGWPMTVLLTPDRQPFFAGTYYPKLDQPGRPGLLTLLRSATLAWQERREALVKAASELGLAVTQALERTAPRLMGELSSSLLEGAVNDLETHFDPTYGGMRGHPKFPPHAELEFLLRLAIRHHQPSASEAGLSWAVRTLVAMSRGGIHDHVGGGFHRYSTDERWHLPHFEKMLGDNALLLGCLSLAAPLAGDHGPLLKFASTGIEQWLGREMQSPEGAFYSAVDADSEGEEGKFYVWTESEIEGILGGDAIPFIAHYGFAPGGNFADESTGVLTGANIPYLAMEDPVKWSEARALLLARREGRPRPETDTKALVGWNGLTIRSLAISGRLDLARRAADKVLAATLAHGRLPRQVTSGRPQGEAFLEDYAYLALGLFELAQELGGEGTGYREQALRLADQIAAEFYDESTGVLTATGDRHEALLGRSRPVFDQPLPSPVSVAIRCFIRAGRMDDAAKALRASLGWVEVAPPACCGLLTALLEFLESGVQEPKEARLSAEARRLPSAQLISGSLTIELPAGMHLQRTRPADFAIDLAASEAKRATVEFDLPNGIDGSEKMSVPFKVRLGDAEASMVRLRVRFQACTQSECLPHEERIVDCVIQDPPPPDRGTAGERT